MSSAAPATLATAEVFSNTNARETEAVSMANVKAIVSNMSKKLMVSLAEMCFYCQQFQSELPAKTSFRGTPTYEPALGSYFSAQEQALSPACIVAPTTSAEISLIVKALAHFNVKFAIRGGGHTLNAGPPISRLELP